ncbi:MAG: branched-chain amino acid ABC transporter permease [Sciscionella sp.]
MSEPVAGYLQRFRTAMVLRIVAVLVLAALPFYLDTALEQVGLFAFSAAIAAIGLNLLTGTTGQLSLGHAFFIAIGAYGYAYFSGGGELDTGAGLQLPPLLALVLAVLLSGMCGLIFSPIASRLRGIYLGIASLALIFIGQHIFFTAGPVTGGFNGRNIAPFSLGAFTFTSANPPLTVLGVPFGQYERLWYLGLVLLVLAYLFAKNLLRGRPGRAMQAVRDSEVAGAVMGVNIRRYKAAAFVISSMYAGLGGAVYALTVSHVVPDSFGFTFTIGFLAMIVIGGLGSVGGAVIGAFFVSALPQLLTQYSDAIPFLSQPGTPGGVDAGSFAGYIYGALMVLILLFQPEGLAGIGRRLSGRRARSPGTSVEQGGGGARPAAANDSPSDPVDTPPSRASSSHQ